MKHAFFIDDADPPAKRKIMLEALKLFSRKGLCETSIRDIAQASGYTNPALYKHFASKDALASALFQACYNNLLQTLTQSSQGLDGFQEQFNALLESYLTGFDANPDAVIFATEHIAKFWPHMPSAMKKRTIITVIRNLIEYGEHSGVIPAGANKNIKSAVVAGALGQLTRLIYLGGLEGSALSHKDDLARTLMASLSG